MAKLLDQLKPLLTKPVTVAIIGVQNSEAYSGLLTAIGEDYIELDNGIGEPHVWIALAAIASVVATPVIAP